MSIILGIDPGTRVTGFGVLEMRRQPRVLSYGVISMAFGAPLPERLGELALGIRELLLKYKPQEAAIENIFLGKNVDSAFKLGHARGVLVAECALAKVLIFEYATRSIKKSLTGKGSAGKDDVNRMVGVHLGLKSIKPMDASDALALALHHAYQLGLPQFSKGIEVSL